MSALKLVWTLDIQGQLIIREYLFSSLNPLFLCAVSIAMSLQISSHSLTPLDHLLSPSYRSPVSAFDLKGKDRDAALTRLEVAVTRLVSHLPFLGASVAPYADPDGRVNTFGVYSAIDDTIPFYELQEHAQSAPLLIDGDLNPELMPSIGHLQPSDPCPIMLLKANVVGDMLYLVHSFYHRAMDGMSLSIVTKVLAQLSCDPDTPAKDLATSAAEQEDMRTYLAELGYPQSPSPFAGSQSHRTAHFPTRRSTGINLSTVTAWCARSGSGRFSGRAR